MRSGEIPLEVGEEDALIPNFLVQQSCFLLEVSPEMTSFTISNAVESSL